MALQLQAVKIVEWEKAMVETKLLEAQDVLVGRDTTLCL